MDRRVNDLSLTDATDELVAFAASPAGKWAYVLTQDSATNRSGVKVVNIEKLETTPEQAVGEAVAVMPNEQDMLLTPAGRSLYAVGFGKYPELCGGVSVLDVNEAACREILWRTLEGCPDCPENLCVPLAAVMDYTYGMVITDREIDNRIRPLAPSTETLKQLILCALETCAGKQEPDKSPESSDLTRIVALSWKHNTGGNFITKGIITRLPERPEEYKLNLMSSNDDFPKEGKGLVVMASNIASDVAGSKYYVDVFDRTGNLIISDNFFQPSSRDIAQELYNAFFRNTLIGSLNDQTKRKLIKEITAAYTYPDNYPGFIIGFSKKVLVSAIDAEHIFQVMVRSNSNSLRCFCAVTGQVIPVKPTDLDGREIDEWSVDEQGRISGAKEVNEQEALGTAFVCTNEIYTNEIMRSNEVWVRLRGDFVVDTQGKAIDAEFLRGELPTGDRLDGINSGIQGGLFESWFWMETP